MRITVALGMATSGLRLCTSPSLRIAVALGNVAFHVDGSFDGGIRAQALCTAACMVAILMWRRWRVFWRVALLLWRQPHAGRWVRRWWAKQRVPVLVV